MANLADMYFWMGKFLSQIRHYYPHQYFVLHSCDVQYIEYEYISLLW